ncbi:uncharacterized protein LOC120319614 isoform X1 [Crotalus tigris]|uniref:uncharacterized protein LOC120319614 isoform X1 n=1 Tax=Crotalus tigris TaxID=88082 RepID=UPI00192F9D9A|nr:uncharacterized protein LOC120319614 isoform X1 [Crotalus tigris]
MSPKIILVLWFPILFLGAGASGAEKLNGRLGWSTIFKVKTNLSFVSISWSKIVGSKSENIALVTFGEPCGLLVPLPAFEKRVNISKDCRTLYLDQIEKEDAGRYTAEIISQNNTVVKESFDLSVYRVTEREYLNGILGESVTFQVKTNLSFVSISWIKIVDFEPENISVVTFGEPCGLLVPLPALGNRVRVSEDCRGLQLSRLEQEDKGFYVAVVLLPTEEIVYEPFDLEISRYLLDSEMSVICTPDGAGKGAWQLNCSTGDWKDRVEFSWDSPIYRPSHVPDDPVIKVTSQDLNIKVTCTAENLISKASRTVTLKEVCSATEGGGPVARLHPGRD